MGIWRKLMFMAVAWAVVVVVAILYGKAAFGLIGLLFVWTITGAIVGGIFGALLGRKQELGAIRYLLISGTVGGIVSFIIAFNQLFAITTK